MDDPCFALFAHTEYVDLGFTGDLHLASKSQEWIDFAFYRFTCWDDDREWSGVWMVLMETIERDWSVDLCGVACLEHHSHVYGPVRNLGSNNVNAGYPYSQLAAPVDGIWA